MRMDLDQAGNVNLLSMSFTFNLMSPSLYLIITAYFGCLGSFTRLSLTQGHQCLVFNTDRSRSSWKHQLITYIIYYQINIAIFAYHYHSVLGMLVILYQAKSDTRPSMLCIQYGSMSVHCLYDL